MEVAVTIKQIEDMKHAIGFEKRWVKRGKYKAYRNYFTTAGKSKSWDELVRLGLATNRDFENGCGENPQVYFVTKEGIKLLERVLEVKIIEED